MKNPHNKVLPVLGLSAVLTLTITMAARTNAQSQVDAIVPQLPGGERPVARLGRNEDPAIVHSNPSSVDDVNHTVKNEVTEHIYSSSTSENGAAENGDVRRKDGETIVVTGTSIRGIGGSAGTESVIVTEKDIEQSGYGTVSQVLQTLPQVFSGGFSEFNKVSTAGAQNFTSSTSPDLRGLGPKATLILINGRRLPSIGLDTTSVDVSSLPVSLIDRVEVLPDGASSVYGSDAVAGVINFIMKKKYEGAETRLRYGRVTEGDLDEFNISQIFGHSGVYNGIIVSYDYYKRNNLNSSERDYSESDDLRRFGGTDRRIIASSPANIINPLTYGIDFAVPEGQDGRNILPSQLIAGDNNNLSSFRGGTDLLPRQRRHSLYITGHQYLSESFEIFIEGRFGDRKVIEKNQSPIAFITVESSHPFYVDAYGDLRPLFLAYNFSGDFGNIESISKVKSYNGVAGFDYSINEDLYFRTHASFSKEDTGTLIEHSIDSGKLDEALRLRDPERVFNPFGDGGDNNPETLNFIAPPVTIDTNFEIWEINSIFDGVVNFNNNFAPRFALGGNFRHEVAETVGTVTSLGSKRFKRDVYAVFGELFLPINNESGDIFGFDNLTISLSGRYDWYKDKPLRPIEGRDIKQSTFNPKAGLSLEILNGFELRASYGTSFVTPSLANRIAITNLSAFPFADPRALTGTSYTLIVSGTGPNLKNEEADTWSIGVNLAPPQLSNLRINLSYFSINFKNRIVANPVQSDLLSKERQFSDIITRTPTATEVLSLCAIAENAILPDVCLNPELAEVIIDGRTLNQAQSIVSGIDGQINLNIPMSKSGSILLSSAASCISTHKFRYSPSDSYGTDLNTYGNPIDFKARFTGTWQSGSGNSVSAIINFADNYKNPLSSVRPNIKSWLTVDLSAFYSTPEDVSNSLLKNLSVTLAIVNLFNEDPPFVDAFQGFDPANANPLGRFISVTLTKKW